MNRHVFTPDATRDAAAELKLLLARVDAGDKNPKLGADILEAAGAPMLIGDPTAFFSSAINLAEHLGQRCHDLLKACTEETKRRVRAGELAHSEITEADVARIACWIALKVHIAKLERAPV